MAQSMVQSMTRSMAQGLAQRLSRRYFLGMLGAGAAIGTGLALTAPALAAEATSGALEASTPSGNAYSPGPKALTARQWAMAIDTRQLTDPARLTAITTACHAFHNVPAVPPPQDVKWIWDDDLQAAFTDELDSHLPPEILNRRMLLLCNHCVNPACTRVCPTGATFRRADGIVVMDYHRCIGCRYCMAACPYGSRSFNFQEPRAYLTRIQPEYPPRMRGVVEKCDFCMELLAIGQMPRCVEASEGAIAFGDLEDPDSPVRRLLAGNLALRRKPTLGTVPRVYYIL